MATVQNFEDLQVWQKARVLAKEVYEVITTGSLASDYRLRDQMNVSSGSIMDNIAEGFERDGRAEMIVFLGYAKGSAGELRSQLLRALDRKHITQIKFEELFNKTIEISKMLSSFMSYLRKSDIKGTKFKK